MTAPSPSLTIVPRRSLFAHIAEVESLADMIDALDRSDELTPEATEALQLQLCAAVAGTKQKVDRVTATLAAFEANSAAAKLEAARLTARAARFERNKDRLETFVLAALSASNLDRIDGETSGVSRRKNPARVIVDDENAVPFDFLRFPPEPPPPPPVVDKPKIATALKNGTAVAGCRLEFTYRLTRS